MGNTKNILYRFKKMSVPLCALLVSLYFAAHAFKSVSNQKILTSEISDLTQEQKNINSIRNGLELHVNLLASDHVDPDYLDQLVRKDLGFSHPDDIIIPNNK
jgi:cell division protein FtsB